MKDPECQVKVWDFILRQCEVLEGFEEKEERAQMGQSLDLQGSLADRLAIYQPILSPTSPSPLVSPP